MDKITKVLMNLIKCSIQKENIDIQQYDALSQKEKEQLFQLCSNHSISVIVGDVLGKSKMIEKTPDVKKLINESFMSVYRYEQSQTEIKKITHVLTELKIPYILLKGPRVRKYYPEPWLRTSCDIDILIHEEDLGLAINGLVEKCSYKKQAHHYHDIHLVSPNNILLELHFNLKERIESLDKVLIKVWDYSSPVDKDNCLEYEQSNEFFLFHLLAHTAYHFQHGGCGIRSILDLYLIHHQMPYNNKKLKILCKEAKIETFYEYVIQLSEVWFGESSHTSITSAMEKYILHGGTYGTKDNNIAMEQTKQGGGHTRYIKSRIFMPYKTLKITYPILKKYKYLTPVYQVIRWSKMLSSGKFKKYIAELHISKHINQEQLDSAEKLLETLKLKL
ncbi:MAG: nucleotidyltransferase family protein [Blautia hansenii]